MSKSLLVACGVAGVCLLIQLASIVYNYHKPVNTHSSHIVIEYKDGLVLRTVTL